MAPFDAAQMAHVLALPFFACAVMTGILGYLGMHVLRREIVFVDIALAQIVAVGAIAAHLLFDAHEDSPAAYAVSFGLAIVAAAFYAVTRRRVLEISVEAVIGVSYAIAAAAALFLLGVAAEGHVHAQHMLAGSILWATRSDVVICSVAFVAVGLCFVLLRRPFARISDDYDAAIHTGMRVVWWDFVFYTLLGVVITFAVRIGGVVVVFCLLIIPATIAVMMARSAAIRLLVAWAAGLVCSVLGLVLAHQLDFSVGPSVAVLLGLGLVVTGLWRRLNMVSAAVGTAVIAAAYAGLVLAVPSRPDLEQALPTTAIPTAGATASIDRQSAVADVERGGEPGPAGSGAESDAGSASSDELSSDPQTRCDEVLAAIDLDRSSGARLALEFLEGDPPLFYRQLVVDGLEQAFGNTVGFEITRPFSDPVNQSAADELRRRLQAPG
jgi:ABC-type Mn2+/Zn2+ transport system permease subunit